MILVTGGAGYIGSHLLSALREVGEPHLAFDNFGSGHRAALQDSPVFEGDLGSPDDLRRVFAENQIDLVMHFAAHISVGESVREPLKYWQNNFVGALNLVEAMREAEVNRLVFSSTAAIFGEPQYLPIDEEHPKAPTSPYGSAKLAVEKMLSEADNGFGLKSVCLRYFNAAGAHPSGGLGEDHDPEEHLIPLAIQAALGLRPGLKVFGSDYDTPDGTCVRDYVHIGDLASAHLLAAKYLRKGAPSRAFNLGNGEGFSVMQVIETVSRVGGSAVPFEMVERRPGDPSKLVASSRRIREELGWAPKHPTLDEIVATAWKWHQSHPHGYDD